MKQISFKIKNRHTNTFYAVISSLNDTALRVYRKKYNDCYEDLINYVVYRLLRITNKYTEQNVS